MTDADALAAYNLAHGAVADAVCEADTAAAELARARRRRAEAEARLDEETRRLSRDVEAARAVESDAERAVVATRAALEAARAVEDTKRRTLDELRGDA